MALVESKEVEQLLLRFLTSEGDGRFAITNGSLVVFVQRVATELDRGTPVASLIAEANGARIRAISSALKDSSVVDFYGRTIPLLRETDGGNSVRACPNFPDFKASPGL